MQTRRKEYLRKQKKSSSIITNPLIKFMKYDFFAEEWFGNCGACYKNFYVPTKYEYQLQIMYHEKSSECIGGW